MEKGRLLGMIEGLVKTVESHWAGVKWGTQGRNNVSRIQTSVELVFIVF